MEFECKALRADTVIHMAEQRAGLGDRTLVNRTSQLAMTPFSASIVDQFACLRIGKILDYLGQSDIFLRALFKTSATAAKKVNSPLITQS